MRILTGVWSHSINLDMVQCDNCQRKFLVHQETMTVVCPTCLAVEARRALTKVGGLFTELDHTKGTHMIAPMVKRASKEVGK